MAKTFPLPTFFKMPTSSPSGFTNPSTRVLPGDLGNSGGFTNPATKISPNDLPGTVPSSSSSSGSSNTTTTTNRPTPSSSAADAHRMIWSIGIGIFVVVMAIILAGINDTWGNAMVLVMVAFLILQAMGHKDILGAFVMGTKYLPPTG